MNLLFSITLLALTLSVPLFAEPLAVSTIQITKEASYQVERVYGGQLKHRRESNMGFETTGTILKVHVQEGEKVISGQALVTLDQAAIKAELQGAQAQTATARANVNAQQAQLNLANLTLKRHQELSKKGHVSSQLLDELSQQQSINAANLLVAQTQLNAQNANSKRIQIRFDKTILRAPYDAVVQARLIDEGSIITPGMHAIQLVEFGKIEAIIGIPQNMTYLLDNQISFEFMVNRKPVPGKLKTTLPQIDRNTGTVTSIFSLDGDHLYGGSLTEIKLSVTVLEEGFWIPLSSLAESQRGLWSVLVVNEAPDTPGKPNVSGTHESTVEARLVEIIHRGKNAVYVRGTLNDGDLIIDSGTGRVVPGQSVRVASLRHNFMIGS